VDAADAAGETAAAATTDPAATTAAMAARMVPVLTRLLAVLMAVLPRRGRRRRDLVINVLLKVREPGQCCDGHRGALECKPAESVLQYLATIESVL
jgi:hypothetical protein